MMARQGIPSTPNLEPNDLVRSLPCSTANQSPCFFHVILHGLGILIGRYKNDFDTFFLGLSVPFLELGSEHAARRTPMGREVESNKLLGGNDIISGNFGVVHLDEGLAFE